MPERIGRQTPTTAHILEYENTLGQEAVNLYEKTGRKAREWQILLIYDIMAVDDDEKWIHSVFSYSVPRRNGKTEDAIMRIIWGLTHGEKIIYTAHRITTAHSVWEKVTALLDDIGIKYASNKAKGQENIRLLNDLGDPYKLDHLINFRTRSSTGGLGEGYDLLVIDEAQEYTIDQETALKYMVSDSANPQTVMLGTPPTAISHGTVFSKTRDKVLRGESANSGWAEWSVESIHDPKDKSAWYETNPSLGYDHAITERAILNEDTTDDVDFNIQRLGHWLKYSQRSAITLKEWEDLKVDSLPELKGKLHVGIKYGKDGASVAMAIGIKTDDKVFVEVIDCRPVKDGSMWIIDFLSSADVADVTIDGAGAQQVLESEIKDYGIKVKVILPTVKEIITANSLFMQMVTSSKTVIHCDQPSLTQVISNCDKRAIGSSGGFGFKSIDERREIALLDSVILACWSASNEKTVRKKQRISY